MEKKDILKRFRRQKNLTQKQVSEKLNMARSTFSKIESGSTRLNMSIASQLSEIYGVSMDEIVGHSTQSELLRDLDGAMFSMDYQLFEAFREVKSWEELNHEEHAALKEHGFTTRKEYESTMHGGRIFKFGPKEVDDFIFRRFEMEMFIGEGRLTDSYWENRYNNYLQNRDKIFVDTEEYFTVFIAELVYSRTRKEIIEFNPEDFIDIGDEWDMIKFIADTKGALHCDLISWCEQGFTGMSNKILRSEL